ncbi:HD domain-containing protein [Clostridium sp. SYSU_GA19001]|uniref:HD domain-containing protein n=1 Tax=Clostridium caldaquaticum TaxID=2940653 RepID=UPI0020771C3D|nr:HD domain-containing protein [Clostridium caldaquaticum]MCM8711609.1 HD domain-containing protein [Clostridium caldaquaticum]
MKERFIKDIRNDKYIEGSFMIMKKLAREGKTIVAIIGDKTGDIKAYIPENEEEIKVGDVIYIKGVNEAGLQVSEYKKETGFDLNDYLPALSKPIDDIMDEIEDISLREFKSVECMALNDYFFKNKSFVDRFVRGIGGLNQHHNYIGGLAEHTLNVMYLTKVMAYRYDCRYKDLAILAAKLHDIGKIEEYSVEGPFSVSMRGEMEGHIVIGVTMIEEAFKKGGNIYSEDFKHRIKGCIVQHHGKEEYGSPKAPNTEEAFIVHYADFVDATFNKIGQVKDTAEPGTWSEYDRRIGTRLYI